MPSVPLAPPPWACAAAFWAAALALSGCGVGCSDPPGDPDPREPEAQGPLVLQDSTEPFPPDSIEPVGRQNSVRDLPGPVASDPCRAEYERSVAPPILSPGVRQTRDRLAQAAKAGDWAAIDSASTRPGANFRFSFGDPDLTPVEYWLRHEGGAFLNDLVFVLATEPVAIGDSYVWPGWSEKEWDDLSSRDREAIECAAGADAVEAMVSEGRYTWVRTAIDADGTWSYYISGD